MGNHLSVRLPNKKAAEMEPMKAKFGKAKPGSLEGHFARGILAL